MNKNLKTLLQILLFVGLGGVSVLTYEKCAQGPSLEVVESDLIDSLNLELYKMDSTLDRNIMVLSIEKDSISNLLEEVKASKPKVLTRTVKEPVYMINSDDATLIALRTELVKSQELYSELSKKHCQLEVQYYNILQQFEYFRNVANTPSTVENSTNGFYSSIEVTQDSLKAGFDLIDNIQVKVTSTKGLFKKRVYTVQHSNVNHLAYDLTTQVKESKGKDFIINLTTKYSGGIDTTHYRVPLDLKVFKNDEHCY